MPLNHGCILELLLLICKVYLWGQHNSHAKTICKRVFQHAINFLVKFAAIENAPSIIDILLSSCNTLNRLVELF